MVISFPKLSVSVSSVQKLTFKQNQTNVQTVF